MLFSLLSLLTFTSFFLHEQRPRWTDATGRVNNVLIVNFDLLERSLFRRLIRPIILGEWLRLSW